MCLNGYKQVFHWLFLPVLKTTRLHRNWQSCCTKTSKLCPQAHNKNQMCHFSSVSQQPSHDISMQGGCGVTWTGVNQEWFLKESSQRSFPEISAQHQHTHNYTLPTWRTERMDAAYKRVNGNYSPEAETGDQVPGVNLTYSWLKSHLCFLSFSTTFNFVCLFVFFLWRLCKTNSLK